MQLHFREGKEVQSHLNGERENGSFVDSGLGDRDRDWDC
jgi:hypothetical protein